MMDYVFTKLGGAVVMGLCFIVMMSSCDREQVSTPVSGDHMLLEIDHPSGDDYKYPVGDDTKYFAPYPFNVGMAIKDSISREIVVVSRQYDRGDDAKVIPVAKFILADSKGQSREIFVAVPIDQKDQIVDIQSFSDLTVQYFTFKQIIEFWYSNKDGLNGTFVKGWYPASLDEFK